MIILHLKERKKEFFLFLKMFYLVYCMQKIDRQRKTTTTQIHYLKRTDKEKHKH
jgi:hypothetical protein